MSPVLLFTATNVSKKQIGFVLTTLVVIVSLPIVAVFSLGGSTLSYLSDSTTDNSSTYAISTTSEGLYQGPEITGNTYAWGNCTYWAYALRLKDGHPIPTSWGNANTWDDRAERDGYLVDHNPRPGDVFQTDNGSLGHVAYVTAVDLTTGNWTISEMNNIGFNIVDLQTYPAAAAQKYNFIHDRLDLDG